MSEHTVLTPHPTPSQSCRWNYKRKTTTVSIHIKFFFFYIAINIRDNEEFETADGKRLKQTNRGKGEWDIEFEIADWLKGMKDWA